MSRAPKQTLAYWRRRALRAEAQVESLRTFREVDARMERSMVIENADMRVAIQSIEDVLYELQTLRMEAQEDEG